MSKITSIDFIKVNSEIEALLLESQLIKKFKPAYNIAAKDDKSPYYIHITREEFPKPVINHQVAGAIAGPFLNSLIPKRVLRQFRQIAPFCLAKRPVQKPCFYSHLGLCQPCPGNKNTPEVKFQYHKNILRLKRLLRGNFSQVETALRRDMKLAAVGEEYEKATHYREYLKVLTYLLSSPISPEEYLSNPNLLEDINQGTINSLYEILKPHLQSLTKLSRIESFDVSHLRGSFATAAMAVAVDGSLSSHNYRHFQIKYSQTDSDVDMMSEVLTRRLRRTDWPVPDLIVLDGGKPQLSIINSFPPEIKQVPPFISLAKPNKTIIIPRNGDFTEINLSSDHPALHLLENLCNEAHRFCRRLHHKNRAKIILA